MKYDFEKEVIDGLKEIFGSSLLRIVLYGSVVRGTDTPESDIDIAIILDSEMEPGLNDQLVDFSVDLDLKYDRVFSIVDINNENFVKWEKTLPFYRNVRNEGVVLWKAA